MILPARLLNLQRCRGQAMAEFVVTVAFIFLALFVIVPTFGKLMDIKFQNQQAARYVAWERTVWLQDRHAWNSPNIINSRSNSDDFVVSNAEFESLAIRSDDELTNSVESRFFYGQGSGLIRPISSADALGSGGETSPLWTYHQSGGSMFGSVEVMNTQEQSTPSIAYDIMNVLANGLSVIASPLNFLMDLVGAENDDLLNVDYNTRGYYAPSVRTSLNPGNAKGGGSGEWDRVDGQWGSGIEDVIFSSWDGRFTANSAILADGWNAQSVAYYKDRADNFVLSTVFDFEGFDVIKAIIGTFEGGNYNNSAIIKLDFADMQVNPMPGEDGQPLPVTCDGGFCYYNENE